MDALATLFVRAVDESTRREIAEADAARAEIKQKGTYWAGTEIADLRRQVARLQTKLARGKR
ncbi:hypothetical protein [Bradyrhizobium sp. SZCCHNRI2007]|uniref:hypothetical protein n=1 Tax=Bradyrhizobium sp. SZCCHNRI2007 TaxID=3057281 RepID=UPI0028E89864|nr:hypothetical protein [Bradyrhizobium sp. SZCCHNRI2007]